MNAVIPKIPPFLNYRAGVSIGSKFYMPLITDSPYCYVFDLDNESWSMKPLKLVNITKINPQVTCAVAVGKKIYLVGGRYLKSYTLSNGMIEIDTDTFEVRIINDYTGTPPRARHEHSVDVVDNRYLIVFGGLCYNSVGKYYKGKGGFFPLDYLLS
jgi:N-acetylneuraminic acid mutarotase